jgi:hypothetical protein
LACQFSCRLPLVNRWYRTGYSPISQFTRKRDGLITLLALTDVKGVSTAHIGISL